MKQTFAALVAAALLSAPALAKTHTMHKTVATPAAHHMMMKSHHMTGHMTKKGHMMMKKSHMKKHA
ncbi:MAG: hypothetical protein M3R44_05030 [Candidatus Eremiobacteraeota bacterium]|nr:hypothetical protein [Candidatus Eremiobacteraeota bacterium]